MRIDLCGETLELHADRALYWPRRHTLIVADVHLGKGAAFRRAGLAIPSGDTRRDLARLDALIAAFSPERLLVLGDLFHAPLLEFESWFADVDSFRARHASLALEVLRGNHDRALHRVPPGWRIAWHEGARHEPPFVFAHEPRDDDRGYGMAGHLHPVLTLRSSTDRLRMPVFWLREHHAVLPSFGGFTGGYGITRGPDERVYAATPDGVLEIPAHR
jgi:DNA ligase-associated metallophosphoesterase